MSKRKSLPDATDSDCLQAMDYLYAYLSGELDDDPPRFSIVEHHLSHCRSCFTRAEMERVIDKRLRDSGKGGTPESLKKRLHKLLDDI